MIRKRLQPLPQPALRVEPSADDPADDDEQEAEEEDVFDDDTGLLSVLAPTIIPDECVIEVKR